MRTSAAVATIATVLLIGAAGPVQAAPWCAWFTGYSSNYDCSYFTFEQCLATIRGVGGYCASNVYPEPPLYPPPPHRKRPQRALPGARGRGAEFGPRIDLPPPLA